MSTEQNPNEPDHVSNFINKEFSKDQGPPADPEAERLRNEQIKQDAERLLAKNAQNLALVRAKCPARHLALDQPITDGPWGAALKHVTAQLGNPKGSLTGLYSVRGNGKTQIAVEAIKKTVTPKLSCRYYTAMSLLIMFKRSFNHNDEDYMSEGEIMARLANHHLLCLDEFGKRSESDWENRLVFELLNQRYNNMKHTLIIGNSNTADFKDALGPSLVSRMQETGGIIECDWESFRG